MKKCEKLREILHVKNEKRISSLFTCEKKRKESTFFSFHVGDGNPPLFLPRNGYPDHKNRKFLNFFILNLSFYHLLQRYAI